MIDVIVAVYQGIEATRRCLGSVLDSAGREPFEVVVVDDASPDAGVVALVDELAAAGRVEHSGPAGAARHGERNIAQAGRSNPGRQLEHMLAPRLARQPDDRVVADDNAEVMVGGGDQLGEAHRIGSLRRRMDERQVERGVAIPCGAEQRQDAGLIRAGDDLEGRLLPVGAVDQAPGRRAAEQDAIRCDRHD